ncbi:MAG: zinc-binding alcohol dehydrogenase family protein [Anaerolineae bacterium]|nr:zinc-binding alcohol dehydrogenase family protein [Anaerolineae bacterium]
MKSISLREPGHFVLNDTPLPPRLGQDEVQVRVRKVGICGTDLHAFTGTQPFFSYPRILGHELALEVIDIGSTQQSHNLHVGDLCCLRPYLNCGTCDACRRGFTNCCMNMQVFGVHRDGGMREVINVPIDKVHKSTVLTAESLALVEMLSIGCHAVERAQVKRDEVVLVVGVGPIGLGVAQFAALAGARVIVADVSDARCAFAWKDPAINYCIDAKQDVIEQLKSVVPDGLPTVVFDATGNAQSMMKSFQFVAHGGRLVFVGLFQGDVTFHDPDFHRRELSLFASRNATASDFDRVIAALEANKINVASWITDRVSPEQMVDAFPTWLAPESKTIKAMLSFDNV